MRNLRSGMAVYGSDGAARMNRVFTALDSAHENA
jgi:hypothetical protein